MAWEILKSKSNASRSIEGCSMNICARTKEDGFNGKPGHSSRLRVDTATLDALRLRVRDRFKWAIDRNRFAVALVPDPKGPCSLSPDSGNKTAKVRLHVPVEVAQYIRDFWHVGYEEKGHTFAVELLLSGGYIEIKRVQHDS